MANVAFYPTPVTLWHHSKETLISPAQFSPGSLNSSFWDCPPCMIHGCVLKSQTPLSGSSRRTCWWRGRNNPWPCLMTSEQSLITDGIAWSLEFTHTHTHATPTHSLRCKHTHTLDKSTSHTGLQIKSVSLLWYYVCSRMYITSSGVKLTEARKMIGFSIT